MNLSFSIYTQFKSKVDTLGLCVSGCEMVGGMHKGTKRVLQDTDLKNPGWPGPKTSRIKTKYQDQSLRLKIKIKVKVKDQSKHTDQGQRLKTSQVLGLGSGLG